MAISKYMREQLEKELERVEKILHDDKNYLADYLSPQKVEKLKRDVKYNKLRDTAIKYRENQIKELKEKLS